jgi:hypothetical protein
MIPFDRVPTPCGSSTATTVDDLRIVQGDEGTDAGASTDPLDLRSERAGQPQHQVAG